MNKSFIIYLILTILLLPAGWFIIQKLSENSATFQIQKIKINGIPVEVELADTLEKRVRGLSGRADLSENRGMLFIYDTPGFYEIWMKDMEFPVDIIWIDKNGKIIDITKNVKPESFPKTFTSSGPAKYILEVNAGFSDKNNLKVGDLVIVL